MTRSLMVWGTSSGAGKSLLATALCRWAARQGLNVAPYKAQNMSNNARVVPGLHGNGWGEIGAAQYFQALAARVAPTVDMNPVLLKPERDTASQVVLQGEVAQHLGPLPWRERSEHLAVAARQSFERLSAQHDLVVIEGAGSPAEINLAEHDYVNLHTARWAQAAGRFNSLIVSDIDRGGAFAHLYGTWALLPDDLQPTLAGFVLNKFRGDASLLAPGPEHLRRLTGVPIAAVLPMRRLHGLPEEDGWFTPPPTAPGAALRSHLHVAVLATPRISNLDEFQPLSQVRGLHLTWAREAADLHSADWVILPGSKQVSGDLAWLREQGLDAAIVRHAAAGKRVLGICGGLQMLGASLHDPEGVDGGDVSPGGAADCAGLGLLPLRTRYAAPKRVLPVQASFGTVQAPWQALAGLVAPAYEIRSGITEPLPGVGTEALACVLRDAQGSAIGWQRGPVLGVYAHGLFESAAVMRALFGAEVPTLEAAFEGLADLVEEHFEAGVLRALMGWAGLP
jgi:adenosylcobyric acid synthase